MKIFDRLLGRASTLKGLLVAAFALCLLAFLPSQQAIAAVAGVGGDSSFPNNAKVVAFGDVTAASTFATASYADLAGSSYTYVPTVNDCTTAARAVACLIEVDWTIDGTKATATTGQCAVFVNGAVVASSARVVGAVTEDIIGGSFLFSNTTVGSQTLKLQCKSGDTNVFTVNFGHVIYREIILPARR